MNFQTHSKLLFYAGNGQKQIRESLITSGQKITDANRFYRWWLVLSPLYGWLFYLALMLFITGNPFDGFSAQRYWGVNSIGNLWNVPKFIFAWVSPQSWHSYRGSFLDRALFSLVVFCVPILWAADKRLIAWIYMLGILPVMSGTFTSSTRYLCVAFPFFIALGIFFAPIKRLWLGCSLACLFAILQIVLVWRYVNFRWAG